MNFPISRYLNVRTAYFPSFSADGQTLTFISNITGRAQAWQVDLAPAKGVIPWPEQVTFAADRVLGVYHSPVAGDPRLLYSHDVGGNENMQLFLLDPRTGEEVCLTEGHESAVHIFGDWSHDGRHILFAANRRRPHLFDLYRQSLDGKAAELIWEHNEPGFLMKQLFAPDGQTTVVVRMASSHQFDLFTIHLETGDVSQLNPPHKQAKFTAVHFSPDGRSLYVNTDLDSDFSYVARLHLETRQWETLVQAEWDLGFLQPSPDGRWLAYVVNEGGVGRLELLDMIDGSTRSPRLPDDSPGLVGWFDGRLTFTADSSKLAFSYTNATRTSDIYLWDLMQDTAVAATCSSHGGIPTDTFVAPELVHYPTFDERDIPAWYFRPAPKSDSCLPVVIIVHGGPEGQFRPYFNFLAQYLVHNGYAVLGTNVRGSTGYGNTYSHLDDVEKRMDSVTDLAYAAHWLKAQPDIDPERIAVYGGSYGGFMVLAAITHYPDLWAAAVNIVGISNFVTFLENTSGYRRQHREAEYGSLARDRDFLEKIAPINHVDHITTPLMVIHGANDPRVPLSEAEQLVAALEARGTPVEFLVFDDEGHGIAKLKNKLVAYPAIVNFLNKILNQTPI
jgi:dipeptidyl aminopeptidase/acylaminoacyl peptidase